MWLRRAIACLWRDEPDVSDETDETDETDEAVDETVGATSELGAGTCSHEDGSGGGALLEAAAEAEAEAAAEPEAEAAAAAGDGGGCWGGPTVAARASFDLARLLLRGCEHGWPSPLPDGEAPPETVALRLLRRAASEGHRGAAARRDEICAAGAACGEDGDRLTPEMLAVACAPHSKVDSASEGLT